MYLLNVSFSQPPTAVLAHQPAHGAWVGQQFTAGRFLFAGPKKSGLGGAILVRSMPKDELLALLQQDPYVRADVVDYQITDFDCLFTAPDLSVLQGA